ncbi:MAG: pilin [Candidatus Doudnabacteria bacterium]
MKQIPNMSREAGSGLAGKQTSNWFKKLSVVQIAQISAIVLTMVLAVAPVAFAQFQIPNSGNTNLPNQSSASGLILQVINIALGVAGLVAVLFLLIGGFRYITSAGNEETAEQARKIIVNAIIGVVVIILSFVIVRVISNALINNQT